MDEEHEQRIQTLAFSLWQSAERPYWVALEYWLMAEKMILEVITATSGCAVGRDENQVNNVPRGRHGSDGDAATE